MAVSLRELLQLEILDTGHFRSLHHRVNFRGALFGGQLLGQALMAACLTCSARRPHSLHAYFLLPGDANSPLDFRVEALRDGRYFSNRRVTASQAGRDIFTLMASFHEGEAGFRHQAAPAPAVPSAEVLAARNGVESPAVLLPEEPISSVPPLFEYINIQQIPFGSVEPLAPRVDFWLRSGEPLQTLHEQCCALAFLSDFGILASALLPHPRHLLSEELLTATLDHAMWFHDTAPDVNQWTLFSIESPWAANGLGLGRSLIYDGAGKLLASAAQEGLIRRYDTDLGQGGPV